MALSGDSLGALRESDPPPAPVTLPLEFKADGANVDASVFTQDHKLNELAPLGYCHSP
jgi:hypothetical protein